MQTKHASPNKGERTFAFVLFQVRKSATGGASTLIKNI